MDDSETRINQEWVTLNAIRGMVKIASKGSMSKSTYDNSLDFGGVLYPELLGPETSLLKRERESDKTKFYREKAELLSLKEEREVTALELVLKDIQESSALLAFAENKEDKKSTEQLNRNLSQLEKSKIELDVRSHSENQLIFRDAYNVYRECPELTRGYAHKDFQLPEDKVLRLRVLHPDKLEYITGADIVYERHDPRTQKVSLVAVQYKIWEDKKLYLSDQRMLSQLEKMRLFTCNNNLCNPGSGENDYRFPCCSGFLRPTDKLQKADQKFISTGEHLPICRIDACKTQGSRGGYLLEYEKIKEVSLSNEIFEDLFNRGKIGSRQLSYHELHTLYEKTAIINSTDTVVIYAQEF